MIRDVYPGSQDHGSRIRIRNTENKAVKARCTGRKATNTAVKARCINKKAHKYGSESMMH
jgi:hypothetical protein